MDARATIRAFLEIRGPSLPYAVGKEIGVNVTFASAYLAEMSDRGMVRISNLKVGGGSPLYYLPGQESQLQNFAQNLGEKQKKAFDMLKEKQVLILPEANDNKLYSSDLKINCYKRRYFPILK